MRAIIVSVVVSLLVVTGCKQKESSPQAQGTGLVQTEEVTRSAAAEREKRDEDKRTTVNDVGGQPGLGPVGLVPMVKVGDRLLEYNVALQYQTQDFMKARALVLNIASRHGFVTSSSASSGKNSALHTEFAVRIDSLYDVLKELDALGDLVSENIQVTDHTENNYAQKLRTDRESLRIARKGRSAEAGDPTAKNWAERQASLEKSEDAQDLAELERWKIKDRVSWARISVNIEGPAAPATIEVPPYQRALIGLINVGLWLSYALIWLSPLLLLGGLLLWKRRWLLGLFHRA